MGYKKVNLVTVVEGDPKEPFSMATIQSIAEGATHFPELIHFTLDPYLIMLGVKQGGIKNLFCVFAVTKPGIEPRSLEPFVNTLTIMPIIT